MVLVALGRPIGQPRGRLVSCRPRWRRRCGRCPVMGGRRGCSGAGIAVCWCCPRGAGRPLQGGGRLHGFLGAPTAAQTALAFRQAIWRKPDPEWTVCRLPSVLYSDHGPDFTGAHIAGGGRLDGIDLSRADLVLLDQHLGLLGLIRVVPGTRGSGYTVTSLCAISAAAGCSAPAPCHAAAGSPLNALGRW